MKIKHILIVFLLFGALLLVGCSTKDAPIPSVPKGAQAGDLVDLKPCTYKPGNIEYSADCGTLVVPENRNNPGSRLIALPVIRVHALGNKPAEPIFNFRGGPGGSNLNFRYLDGLIDSHDFVQVGYRGVDGSVVLNCPEIADALRNAHGSTLSDAALVNYGKASSQCAARLKAEGVDLAGYTITEVINDMEDARAALGYDRIDLLGGSYGTRIEMIYEWMYPNSLHRVVMLAVNPPGHFVWSPEVVDAQIKDYAKLCAKDPECSSRTDDLVASMRHVSENMPDHWLFIPIDKDAVKFLTFMLLMESTASSGPTAIDMWLAAEKGDPSGMALLSMSANLTLPNTSTYGDLLAKGSSGGDFIGRVDDSRNVLDPQGSILGSPASLFHWSIVRTWPAYPIPEQYVSIQTTNVETLLISGSIDFATPPQFATEELLPHLSNGKQVILKDFGHTETFWNSQPEARSHLLNTFFDTGKVDSSLYKYQPVNFDVGLGLPGLAKLALGIVAAVLILLVALVWFVIRRIMRYRTAHRI